MRLKPYLPFNLNFSIFRGLVLTCPPLSPSPHLSQLKQLCDHLFCMLSFASTFFWGVSFVAEILKTSQLLPEHPITATVSLNYLPQPTSPPVPTHCYRVNPFLLLGENLGQVL